MFILIFVFNNKGIKKFFSFRISLQYFLIVIIRMDSFLLKLENIFEFLKMVIFLLLFFNNRYKCSSS